MVIYIIIIYDSMYKKVWNIDTILDRVDEFGGTVWGLWSITISSKHRDMIDDYLYGIGSWIKISMLQWDIHRLLSYKKTITPRYIYDTFSGKNTQFNDKYVWSGKLFSHKDFFSIEEKFRAVWYQALASELENIIKSSIDF